MAHELDLRIDADGAEQIARDGIEKSPVEVAVRPPRHEHLIGALDVDPKRVVGAQRLQVLGDRLDATRHPLLVELDACDRIELRGVPVLGEEIQRRAAGDAPEFLVVGAEVLGDRRRVLLRRPHVWLGASAARWNCSVSVLPAMAPVGVLAPR